MVRFSNWQKVGTVGVDSGQIMLVDPCYVKQTFETAWNAKPGLNYAGACEATLSDKHCGNFGGSSMAFATSSGYGDGEYDVYVRRLGDRIAEVKIVFIDSEEE